ncbi:hypothetical protein hrd7_01390 [Leptolinea sp. HRD-7]|nr:hypothetical protein hrd7_01390 [Leptolinea sp. HRD-7]
MRIFKNVLISLIASIPAAIGVPVFLLKGLYRQPLQAFLLFIGLMVGLGLLIYFLINPHLQTATARFSGRQLGGLFLVEILAAICLVYLVPFHTPLPDHIRLTISPADNNPVELLEVRLGESVVPLTSALVDGSCKVEPGLIAAQNQTCRISFEIPRPKVAPTHITLLFSNGPDFTDARYSLEWTRDIINLRDEQYGEVTTNVPSPVPSQTVDLIFFFVSALLLGEMLFLGGLLLSRPLTDSAANNNSLIGVLARGWARYRSFILPALAVYAVLPVASSLFFPMELELRESTKWLHALALGAGLNIYDNSITAFINMSHGPMDALLKSFLLWIKVPTIILRWTVPAFLLTIFLAAWWIIRGETRTRLEHAMLATIVLDFTLIAYNQVIITGQTETCAALLLVLTMLFMEKAVTGKRVTWLYSLLAGVALMCTFLSNWRYGPTLAAAGIVFLVRLAVSGISLKHRLVSFLLTAAGGLLIFGGLLGRYFNFDFLLYFNHFFGFYKDLGEKLFFDVFLGTQMTATTGLTIFLLIGLALLIRLSPKKEERAELTAWALGLAFIFVTTVVAFYLNGAGGGIHYYYPLIIFAWFLFLRYHDRIPHRESLLPVASVVILFISGAGFSPVQPLLTMKDTWERASNTMKFLKQVNKTSPIWTEDIHLFKEEYSGETVDMGDYDSFYRKSGMFPEDFNALVDAHFAEMRSNPPEVVIISIASSPELRKYAADNNYRKIAGYHGWIDTEFDLLVRPDSRIEAPPEIR